MACEAEYERCLSLRGLLCSLAISILCCRVAAAPSTSSGQAPGTCVSQGGRFPRFVHDGQLPRKSSKGPNDLTLCRIYKKKTCCTSSQTRVAVNSLRKLASNGEANNTCLELWEVLECAICDPHVGTKPGPPVICSSFCESVFMACADAFFAMDSTSQILMPCGPKDTICARAKEWTRNSSAFCQLLGYSLRQSKNELDASCFDGKIDIESKGFSSTTGRETRNKDGSVSSHEDFLTQIDQMDLGEKIVWAIGGLVLTAAAAYWRYRRSKSRQKRVALFRNIQEARARQQAASNAATSKAVSRMARKF